MAALMRIFRESGLWCVWGFGAVVLAETCCAGCAENSSSDKGRLSCTACRPTASSSLETLPYTQSDLASVVTGTWAGEYPAGNGLPAFAFELRVAPDESKSAHGFEAYIPADSPSCQELEPEVCPGMELPVRVRSQGFPTAFPEQQVAQAGQVSLGNVDTDLAMKGENLATANAPVILAEGVDGRAEIKMAVDQDGTMWLHVDDGIHDAPGDSPDEPEVYHPYPKADP